MSSGMVKDIYQSAVEHQSREIEKVIINQSSEHHLNEDAAYVHVALETWENWTCNKKQRYPFVVKHLNLDDTKVKKVINSSFWEVDKVSYSPGNFKDIYQVFCMLILLKGKR